jgi:hypothetical protein
MPAYRIDGLLVFVKGTKLPPACEAIAGQPWPVGNGQRKCMTMSRYLCDWPAGEGKTCDRALCEAHATPVGKNRHYCPAHLAEHKAAERQLGLFTSLVKN